MRTYKVRMREAGRDRIIEQTAVCESRQQVVDWYGLEELDIEWYEITEEDER